MSFHPLKYRLCLYVPTVEHYYRALKLLPFGFYSAPNINMDPYNKYYDASFQGSKVAGFYDNLIFNDIPLFAIATEDDSDKNDNILSKIGTRYIIPMKGNINDTNHVFAAKNEKNITFENDTSKTASYNSYKRQNMAATRYNDNISTCNTRIRFHPYAQKLQEKPTLEPKTNLFNSEVAMCSKNVPKTKSIEEIVNLITNPSVEATQIDNTFASNDASSMEQLAPMDTDEVECRINENNTNMETTRYSEHVELQFSKIQYLNNIGNVGVNEEDQKIIDEDIKKYYINDDDKNLYRTLFMFDFNKINEENANKKVSEVTQVEGSEFSNLFFIDLIPFTFILKLDFHKYVNIINFINACSPKDGSLYQRFYSYIARKLLLCSDIVFNKSWFKNEDIIHFDENEKSTFDQYKNITNKYKLNEVYPLHLLNTNVEPTGIIKREVFDPRFLHIDNKFKFVAFYNNHEFKTYDVTTDPLTNTIEGKENIFKTDLPDWTNNTNK